MKARVKATGDIVEVKEEYDLRGKIVQVFYSNEEDPYDVYEKEELEFFELSAFSPDYWEKLKHQYAGMAMQGMVKTYEQMIRADIECKMDCCEQVDAEVANGVLRSHAESCAEFCVEFAMALVEKLKEEK